MKKNNRNTFANACLSKEDMQKMQKCGKQKENQSVSFKLLTEKEINENRNKAYKFLL